RTLDNVLYLIRCICQNPNWESLVAEESIFPNSISEVCIEFLRMGEMSLKSDPNMLASGPVFRIKTAINFCVIVERLSEALLPIFTQIENLNATRKGHVQENSELWWRAESRRNILNLLKHWYNIITDLGVAVASGQNSDRQKMLYYRHRLVGKIGQTVEKLLNIGDPFENRSPNGNEITSIPQDILVWMGKLQSNGYSVFTPAVLYNYGSMLGSVLEHSYSGRSEYPMVFTDAVFDQLLPRIWLGPQIFLSGDQSGVNSSEDYIASIHALPPSSKLEGNSIGLINPVITPEISEKMQQNLGSLLFFGLFNMMNSNKMIRNRSFLFVRELYKLYGPDKTDETEEHFVKFTGGFYSNVGNKLKEKILVLTKLASVQFADVASPFLWEAVRCSRSAQADKTLTLIPTQQWILMLILPWCKHVNFRTAGEDIVSTEFYRYIMDSAFFRPKYFDDVQACWKEVIVSAEFGSFNTRLLTESLVQICGKFEKLREETLALLSQTFAAFPAQVASSICYHLGSGAFPWKPYVEDDPTVADPHHITPTPLVREYIRALHSSLQENVSQAAFDNANEYASSCKSSVMLLSELLLQNYYEVQPHLPILLNYVVLHLPKRLQENSVSTYLLANMVEGFISMLHVHKLINNQDFKKVQDDLRRLLVLLDTTVCFIDWDKDPKSQEEKDDKHLRIPIAEFIDLLLSIFSTHYDNLTYDLAMETLSWAAEGYLGPDHTVRAIETFTILIRREPPLPREMLNALSSRLFDHVNILATLETEAANISLTLAAATSVAFQENGTTSQVNIIAGWDNLSEARKILKSNTENVLISILTLHQTLINLHAEAGELMSHPKLFWGSLCMLNVPSAVFPRLYSLSVDNCRTFLQHQYTTAGIMEEDIEDAYVHIFDRVRSEFIGIQPLVLQSLFPSGNSTLQYKSFDLLLQGWFLLPEFVVDSSPDRVLALLYTVLYTITAIFGDLESKMDVLARQLHKILSNHPLQNQFEGILMSLKMIESGNKVNNDELLVRCTDNIARVFIPEYSTNIAGHFAIKLSTASSKVVLKMSRMFWALQAQGLIQLQSNPVPQSSIQSFAQTPIMSAISPRSPIGPISSSLVTPVPGGNPFKGLARKLPFLKENLEDVTSLISFLLQEIGEKDGMLKEIDLTANGRVDGLSEVMLPIGSARLAKSCLSVLGVQPSARMYITNEDSEFHSDDIDEAVER
ncbi:hypothetical protein HK096_009170, partial [Nowakowskiella sp. JEL0078]